MGFYCFEYCSKLETINFPNVVKTNNYCLRSTAITNVTLPLATNVASYCFNSCSKLTQVKIPKAQTMGTQSFGNCPKLTDIYCGYENVVVLSNKNAFDSSGTTQGYINIHVKPNLDLPNQYASATNWTTLITAGTIIIVEDYTDD